MSDLHHHADCERRAFARRVKPETRQSAAAAVGIGAHAGVEAVIKAGLHLQEGSMTDEVAEVITEATAKAVPTKGQITWDDQTPGRDQAIAQSNSLAVRVLSKLGAAGLVDENLQAEQAWEVDAGDGIVVRARADLVLAGEACADIKTGRNIQGTQLQLGGTAVLAAAVDAPINFERLSVIHAPRKAGPTPDTITTWSAEPVADHCESLIGDAVETARRLLDAGDGEMTMPAIIAMTTANPTSKLCTSWACPLYRNGCPLTEHTEGD